MSDLVSDFVSCVVVVSVVAVVSVVVVAVVVVVVECDAESDVESVGGDVESGGVVDDVGGASVASGACAGPADEFGGSSLAVVIIFLSCHFFAHPLQIMPEIKNYEFLLVNLIFKVTM